MSGRRWTLYLTHSGEGRVGMRPTTFHAGYRYRDDAIATGRRLLSDPVVTMGQAVVRAEVLTPGETGPRRATWRGERRDWFGPDGTPWSRSTDPVVCEIVGAIEEVCADCGGTGGTGWVADSSGAPWDPCETCWPRLPDGEFRALTHPEIEALYPGFFNDRSTTA